MKAISLENAMDVHGSLERGIDAEVAKNPWRSIWFKAMDVQGGDVDALRRLVRFRKDALKIVGKFANAYPVISDAQAREYAGYLAKLGIDHGWTDPGKEDLFLWVLFREDSGSSPHAYQDDTSIVYRYYIAEDLAEKGSTWKKNEGEKK